MVFDKTYSTVLITKEKKNITVKLFNKNIYNITNM